MKKNILSNKLQKQRLSIVTHWDFKRRISSETQDNARKKLFQ